MSVYNLSFMYNATNPLDLVTGISGVTEDPFLVGKLILLTFFLIVMIFALSMDFKETLIIDGFLTTILAILLAGAGMVTWAMVFWPALIFILALVFFFAT